MRLSGFLVLGVLVTMSAHSVRADDPPTSAGIAFFETKIRPVLVEHCYSCHSVKSGKSRGGLFLDTRSATRDGGDTGPAVVPGHPEKSLLIAAVRDRGKNDTLRMPPKQDLPPSVVADLVQWVTMGAPDPRDGSQPSGSKGMSVEEGRSFWSIVPPKRTPPPTVRDTAWPETDVDRFLLARMESAGLTPTADATPETFLRRVTFALIGLPPTPEEIDAFVSDPSPEARAAVVDRLLASPMFGQRWGRHWLDVARYGESNGGARNFVWHHAWHYRDYVIDAFNDDRPYREFIREQIAGDLLPAATSAQRDRQLIATGFLALGSKPFDEINAQVFRMNVVDEQIDVVSRSFLGLSIACARCHDHKFDPIPTSDYYAMAGIFKSTALYYGKGDKFETDLKPVGPEADRLAGPAAAHLEQVKQTHKKMIDARVIRYGHIRRVTDIEQRLAKPGADREKLSADLAIEKTKRDEWDVKAKDFEAELNQLQANPPPQPDFAMCVGEAKGEDCRVHVRGETTNLGDAVPRGVLQVLPVKMTPIAGDESGRRQLADWIASRDNPLTARVMVNRVWRHLFGRGLVASIDDFGVTGSRPSHPELLDYLAVQFTDDDSIKTLIRRLVLSRAFRISSESTDRQRMIDADNILLSRAAVRRLEVEAFRDAIVFVGGGLDPAPTPNAIARLDRFKDLEFQNVKLGPINDRQRTVFCPMPRNGLPEMLKLFDFSDPYRPVAERDETVVPAQAAFLVNSPWMIEQARQLAKRVVEESPSLEEGERLKGLYRRLLSRSPSDAEIDRAFAYFESAPAGQSRLDRWTSLAHALIASAEFRYLR